MYIEKSQVVIAQAFGMARDCPGRSNEALALIAQIEVAEVLTVFGVPVHTVVRAHRQPGKYLDTVEVLRQAKAVCDPASTQWWTRGPIRFMLRELLAWPMSMWATRM